MAIQSPQHAVRQRMILDSYDLAVTHCGHKRNGFYEISRDGKVLARRIDLPIWLDGYTVKGSGSLLVSLQKGSLSIPTGHTHERQGHILWNAVAFGSPVPMVGVDTEIFDEYMDGRKVTKIVFVVNKLSRKPIERWSVTYQTFFDTSKVVQTIPSFAPQRMMPVTWLTRA